MSEETVNQEQITELETEVTSEEAFDQAFEEVESADSEPEAKDQVAAEADSEPGTEAQEEVEEPAEKEAPAEEPPAWQADIEKLNKRVEDNQAHNTKLSQENAELKAKLADLTKEKAAELPPNVQEFLEANPDMTSTVEFLAQKLVDKRLEGIDLDQLKNVPTVQNEVGQMRFVQQGSVGVLNEAGEFIEGHADFPQIVNSGEFLKWVETFKKDKLGKNVSVIDAIKDVTEFKEFKAAKAAKAYDAEKRKEAKEIEKASGSAIRGEVRSGAGGALKADENDFDGAWEEAPNEID
jgi:hypothetical protein